MYYCNVDLPSFAVLLVIELEETADLTLFAYCILWFIPTLCGVELYLMYYSTSIALSDSFKWCSKLKNLRFVGDLVSYVLHKSLDLVLQI